MPPLRQRRKPSRPPLRNISKVLSEARPEAVQHAASQLHTRLADERWLILSNRYLNQAPSKIRAQLGRKQQLTHPAGTPAAAQLAEYVAASTILHCADGWAYLGRAMAAQLRGDIGAARHLAYYAELRAAISLLAGQGLGVFSNIHVILKQSGEVELLAHLPTHRFTWVALEAWTGSTQSGALFGEIIQPADAQLADWLAPLAGPAVTRETGRSYLRDWGVDVARFGDDRDARNDSSYQPRTFLGAVVPPSTRAAEFSRDFWQLFEPDGATRFGLLDRYLLRRTLKQMFKVRTGKNAFDEPQRFTEFFNRALDELQTSETRGQLTDFLVGKSFAEEPPLFAEAKTHSKMDDLEDHLQVIARAALLLRVASGSARQLLREAALGYAEFEWWVRKLAATRALFGDGKELLPALDSLWGDIDQALVDLDDKLAAGKAETYVDLNQDCARELSMLGGCERIALWGLAA